MATLTTRDGCDIAYRDTGAGEESLLLLHGWSQSQAMFDRLLSHLPPRLRVITYDMRSHGESGRTQNGARIAALAADLDGLLDHLSVGTAHLLGHSMGASVLWSYIDRYGTDRIQSLVLVDQPSVCTVMPWMNAAEGTQAGAIMDVAGAAGFARRLIGPDSSAVRRAFLTSMLTPGIPREDLEWLYQENLKLAMPFGVRLLMDHLTQDWRDVLTRIDVPTLVTGGEISHVVPASQEWIATQIPAASLKIFSREEGGAHAPFFESPQHFAAALMDFLNRV